MGAWQRPAPRLATDGLPPTPLPRPRHDTVGGTAQPAMQQVTQLFVVVITERELEGLFPGTFAVELQGAPPLQSSEGSSQHSVCTACARTDPHEGLCRTRRCPPL
jgi:hypothetical protein